MATPDDAEAPPDEEPPSAAEQGDEPEPVEDPQPVEIDGQDLGEVARQSKLQAESLGIQRRRPTFLHGGVDVLIVTAVDAELDALRRALRAEEWRNADGVRPDFDLWHATVGEGVLRYDVALLKGAGAGAQQVLLAIDHAIRELTPQLVLLAGIAAGRPDKNLAIGDIVVSTSIIAIAYERRGTERRDEVLTTVNRNLVERLKRFTHEHWTERPVAFGPVIATNDVVRDAGYRDRLFDAHREALALEMEGGALAEACERNYLVGSRFAVVKAVVDFADEGKDDSAHASGSDAVARLLRAFLEDGPLPRRRGRRAATMAAGDEGAAWPVHRVPESALDHGARTFVPPPAYAAAEGCLAAEGFVVLAGRRHTGRRTAARMLLADRHGDVAEFDLAQGRDAVGRVPIEPDVGYILSIDATSDADNLVRMLRERAAEVGSGLVVCALPGHTGATGGRPELCVEWRPPEGDLLIEAVRRHVIDGRDTEWRRRTEEVLDHAGVRARVLEVGSTRELMEAASMLHRGIEEGWPESLVAGSIGRAARAALCDRIQSLDDLRVQAWFVALAVLGPVEPEDLTRAAEELCRLLAGVTDASTATSSPFGGPSRQVLLERIGAVTVRSSSGSEMLGIPGVDPSTALSTLWTEFSALRPVLVSWLAEAPETASDDALRPLAIAVAELVRLDLECAFLEVLHPWGESLRVRSVVLTDAVLRRAIDNGADASLVFGHLHEAACSGVAGAAVTSLLVLGGLVGQTSPPRAVTLLNNVLRRDDVGEVERGAAAAALAHLLAGPTGTAEVLALLRHKADDICNTPTLKRSERHLRRLDEIVRILFALDPAALADNSGLKNDTVRRETALLLASLLGNSTARRRMLAVLRRWAARARSNEPWADWYVELILDILDVTPDYRARTVVETLLRRLSGSPLDRPLVERIRASVVDGARRSRAPERTPG